MVQSQEPAASGGGSSSAGGQATRAAEPSAGSRTETQARAQPQGPVLTLTGAHNRSRGPRVRWDENVVDNEGMGKKSSKGTLLLPSATVPPSGPWEFNSPFFVFPLSFLADLVLMCPNSLLHLPCTQGNGRI